MVARWHNLLPWLIVSVLQALMLAPPSSHAATLANPWVGDPLTRLVRVRSAASIVLPWEALAASGWDLAHLPVERVQVWRQGSQIPIQVTATDVRFRAEASESPSSQEATYWLVVGPDAGLRTIVPATLTQPLRWEPDLVYQSLVRSARGDRWFAGELRTGGVMLEASITLPNTLPSGSVIDLALTPFDIQGDHQLKVWHGDTLVGSVTWDDAASGPRTVQLTTSAALPAGALMLRLVLTSPRADVVFVDSLSISAALVALPTLTPLLERPRPAPTLGASDQQVLAHPDLIPALAPLVDAKRALGRNVAVTDVLAIYDVYSWGERDPEAIRAFLRDLSQHSGLPDSVLLVGAGTARLRYGPGDADLTQIPPYLIDLDPAYGEVACDSCYTRLATSDPRNMPLPGVAIGRLPARTPAEAEVLVAKTVTVLLAPPPGAWRGRMLLVADNDRDALGIPDPAGPFAPRLGEIAAALPDLQAESFVYAPDQPETANGRYASAPVLRERLLTAWDNGAALVAYVGHASPWQWAWTGPSEPVAHLLARSDAVRTNNGRLPILLSMTCLSGSFAHPTLAPIDEELLRQPGGGIVAAISPSGSGVNTGHARLLAGSLPALRAGQSLGAAHLAGLEALLAQPADRELAFSYNILGDPDVRLPVRSAAMWQIALPEVVR